ncbi:MAG: pyridoxamine 5'-phosphate oxidase [Candidatus Woesearchaeota archaeon]
MALKADLSQIRNDYKNKSFNENIAKANPLEQFQIWFDEMLQSDFVEPTAMALATSSKNGMPNARMVLLKQFDTKGFVFFTNYQSPKAIEIDENPWGCLLFYWDKLARQVRITGRIEKISKEESEAYFETRPYTSRLGAWASKQSQPLKSRFSLIREVVKMMAKYPTKVPLPPFWGGYRLIPSKYEFWQGRESRLHDRLLYTKETNSDKWIITRLYP